MSEFFPLSHIFRASFCSLIHIFRFQGGYIPGILLILFGFITESDDILKSKVDDEKA